MNYEVLSKRDSLAYRKTKKDPTAWELYQLEHPGLSTTKQLKGFALMTFCVMGLILGTVYGLQHLDQLIFPAILILAAIGFRKYK